jgi:hypothetical protein
MLFVTRLSYRMQRVSIPCQLNFSKKFINISISSSTKKNRKLSTDSFKIRETS